MRHAETLRGDAIVRENGRAEVDNPVNPPGRSTLVRDFYDEFWETPEWREAERKVRETARRAGVRGHYTTLPRHVAHGIAVRVDERREQEARGDSHTPEGRESVEGDTSEQD